MANKLPNYSNLDRKGLFVKSGKISWKSGYDNSFTVGNTDGDDYVINSDGSNSHVQIQQALDKLESLGGGTLFLTARGVKYKIPSTEEILVPDNINIIGISPEVTIVEHQSVAVNKYIFKGKGGTVTGSKNITIKNIWVKALTTNPVIGVYNHDGIFFRVPRQDGRANILIENVKATNLNGVGVHIAPIFSTLANNNVAYQYENVIIRDVYTEPNTVGAGVILGTGAKNCTVERYTGGSIDSAVAVFEAEGCIVKDCHIIGNPALGIVGLGSGQGIEFSTTTIVKPSGNKIINNTIEGVRGNGIYLNFNFSSPAFFHNDNLISGNTVFNIKKDIVRAGNGINLVGVSSTNVCDNIIHSCEGHGIEYLASSLVTTDNNIIHDNIIYNNGQLTGASGIFVGVEPEGKILNNSISNNKIFDNQATKTQNYGLEMSINGGYPISTYLSGNKIFINDLTRNKFNDEVKWTPLGGNTGNLSQIISNNTFLNNF